MKTAPIGKLFCFGFGYCAQEMARRLNPRGVRIAGTCRNPSGWTRLSLRGIEMHLFDGMRPLEDFGAALGDADAILVSIPPGPEGDPVLAFHDLDLRRCRNLRWVGYLSTTGVYGDRAGGWVDETADLQPAGERGARRAQAEAGWLALWREAGLPVHVFRLAGIYGPGQNQLVSILSGRAQRVVKPGQVFSRIHVSDIAAVLEASMARPNPGAIYNVCDDEPAPPQDVIAHAARLLGREPPPEIPFEQAELSPMGRSFYAENKRVSNRRIKDELGVRLLYPTYREGLAALLAYERESAR
ncbi:MAG: SDR family oxidoreductase [Alphaproteobacteria bacterium]|nr:SDR family oxidoreductase [Alphaproteobacteria bacterium]